LAGTSNTIVFERDTQLKEKLFKVFATNHSPDSQANCLSDLLCCLPLINAPALNYSNVFRVLIMQFMDAWNFDMRAMKKSCVHIAQPDGRLIPFEAFNLLYRDDQQTKLAQLRQEVRPAAQRMQRQENIT